MFQTTKETVLQFIVESGKEGLTVPEFLSFWPSLLPQTVYPCFTQLCKAKKILASKARRKSNGNRRSIVWVDAKYGGTVPVWGSSQPSYSYRNRAKTVMDLLGRFGPLSVSEMIEVSDNLQPMSASSLVSRLVRQQWIHKTNRTRLNSINQTCCLYALTPRGRQIVGNVPMEGHMVYRSKPRIRKDTEKMR